MKYLVLDLKTNSAHVFTCKTTVADFVGASRNSISNWQKLGRVKQRKNYLICFDVTLHKARQMVRASGVDNLRKGNSRI